MTILLTGATGYIGHRLKERLLARPGVRLRLLVRNARKLRGSLPPAGDTVEGDTFRLEILRRALEGTETA